MRDLGITYPVALDNDLRVWRAFNNQYWPAHYFIDVQGRIRHHHFGEGAYDRSEKVIQQLLAGSGAAGRARRHRRSTGAGRAGRRRLRQGALARDLYRLQPRQQFRRHAFPGEVRPAGGLPDPRAT